MNNITFLISAYVLLWVILFGYVFVMFRRLKKIAQQIEILKSEDAKNK